MAVRGRIISKKKYFWKNQKYINSKNKIVNRIRIKYIDNFLYRFKVSRLQCNEEEELIYITVSSAFSCESQNYRKSLIRDFRDIGIEVI